MDIAVIIPAHNAAGTIGQTIASVQAQQLAPREIVVVDDGSSDDTGQIVLRLAAEDRRIAFIAQPRSGPAAARNRAIARATAQILAPIDADDLWDGDYLAVLSAALSSREDAGFAYCRHRLIDMAGRVTRVAPAVPLEEGCFGGMLLVNPVGNGSSAIFRRRAVVEAGGYAPPSPEWFGAEDYLLQLRIAAKHPIVRVDRVLSSYRIGNGSLSENAVAARRARLQALDVALSEFGPCSLPARRWASADAARVYAASALRKGDLLAATGSALHAAAIDPTGTAADLARRFGNLLARWQGRPPAPLPDPLLAKRASMLQQALPFGVRRRASAAPIPDSAATAAPVRSPPRNVRPAD